MSNKTRLPIHAVEDAATQRALRAVEEAINNGVGTPGPAGAAGATGATGPAGPAPSGTGLVRVTGGVIDARAELSGDVTTAGALATTLGSHVVSNAKFRQSAALSVVGNATNAVADVADISGPNDGDVLKRSGTALVWSADLTTLMAIRYFMGDGSDGALNFDGSATVLGLAPASSVYTMTRDIFATTITIGSAVTIKLNGYGLFATGTISGTSSVISAKGNNGAAGGATGAAAGGAATTAGSMPATVAGGGGGNGTAGGAGSVGANSPSAPYGYTAGAAGATAVGNGASGVGGQGGNGGGDGTTGGSLGGTVTIAANSDGPYPQRSIVHAMNGRRMIGTQFSMGTGGGGGRASAGCGGGGGGAGGGWAVVMAKEFTGTVTINAEGGDGGRCHTTGNGGGGGGGGGGVAAVGVCQGTLPTISAAGGAGGAGHGTGGNGGTGGAGLVLTYH